MNLNAKFFTKLQSLKNKEKAKELLIRHATECHSNIVAAAPRDTGVYAASIKISNVIEEPDGIRISIYTDLDSGWHGKKLADFLENGTGIYRVDGTGRQTPWVWYSERYKRFVFTRGMIARPHWVPAFEIQKQKLKIELERGL